MNIETRRFGKGTALTVSYPWGINIRRGSKALCSDGKVRSLSYLAQTADTFFSIPASVRVNGKKVTGYCCFEDGADGHSVFAFRHNTEHKGILPDWPNSFTPEYDTLTGADLAKYAKHSTERNLLK